MLEAVLAVAVALAPVPAPAGGAGLGLANPKIDDARFLEITAEAIAARAERRLWEAEFARLALAPAPSCSTPAAAVSDELLHVKGAASLPFTEFTTESLARLVPGFDTPILIYCNNNSLEEGVRDQAGAGRAQSVDLRGPPHLRLQQRLGARAARRRPGDEPLSRGRKERAELSALPPLGRSRTERGSAPLARRSGPVAGSAWRGRRRRRRESARPRAARRARQRAE